MVDLGELRDQTLHAITAATIITAAQYGIIGGALAGFIAGAIREVTEEGSPVTLDKIKTAITKSKHDLTFWTLGGALAGLLTT